MRYTILDELAGQCYNLYPTRESAKKTMDRFSGTGFRVIPLMNIEEQ